jgi:hypothetical protein
MSIEPAGSPVESIPSNSKFVPKRAELPRVFRMMNSEPFHFDRSVMEGLSLTTKEIGGRFVGLREHLHPR